MFDDDFIFDTFVSKDVVLVIPGFRLGIFSHFVVEDQSIAPTNVAFYDILKALEFVKSEIYNFGGDKLKMTILGHSYGGTITAMLTFSTRLNYDLRIQRQIEDAGYPNYGRAVLREPLFQNVKVSEFMNSPKKIPILTGCTNLEFDHEPEYIPLASVFGFENEKECEEKYRNDLKTGRFDRGNHTDKTQAIVIPTKMRVDKNLENGIPAYLYEYTYPKHGKHGNDLYYLMGIHPFEEDENEIHLKQIYRNMIINFVKNGNPGDGFEISDIEKSKYYNVYWNETSGERPKMKEEFEKMINDYWLKEMMEYDRNITQMKQNKSIREMRYSPLNVDSYSPYQPSYIVSSFLLLLLVFFAGYFIGKCYIRNDRVLYLRLDGNNYENFKNQIL
uniref:COesterase domain-containing protein n=1 Tax=Caenorhabditis tropicalis TaxID=1561998 RepID=A0A1I7UNP8_9PELO